MAAGNHNRLGKLIQDPSFRRWVQGEAAVQEKQVWDRWVMESPANRALALKAQEEIEGFAFGLADEPSAEKVWKKVLANLEAGKNTGTASSLCRTSAKGSNKSSRAWAYRVAAGFLLVAACSFLIVWFYHAGSGKSSGVIKKEVATDHGERKVIRLSDGSKIMLNGNSGLVYTVKNNDATAVDLFLRGEAHFSVAKRKAPEDAPFRIRTADGLITVLGTRLVVLARGSKTQVVLEEGSVAINPAQADTSVVLEPGQLGELNSSRNMIGTRFVDVQRYTSWTEGQLYFKNASIDELAQRLQETYGIRVVLRDSTLRGQKVSGSVEDAELRVITSALEKMLNTTIQQSKTDDVIYIGQKNNS